jgi:hypothetical protein
MVFGRVVFGRIESCRSVEIRLFHALDSPGITALQSFLAGVSFSGTELFSSFTILCFKPSDADGDIRASFTFGIHAGYKWRNSEQHCEARLLDACALSPQGFRLSGGRRALCGSCFIMCSLRALSLCFVPFHVCCHLLFAHCNSRLVEGIHSRTIQVLAAVLVRAHGGQRDPDANREDGDHIVRELSKLVRLGVLFAVYDFGLGSWPYEAATEVVHSSGAVRTGTSRTRCFIAAITFAALRLRPAVRCFRIVNPLIPATVNSRVTLPLPLCIQLLFLSLLCFVFGVVLELGVGQILLYLAERNSNVVSFACSVAVLGRSLCWVRCLMRITII